MHSSLRSSLLSSLLSCLLLAPACDEPDEPPDEPRGTARFSAATPEQLELALASIYAPWTFTLGELLVASLDSNMSAGQCPQIAWSEDRATITGNGCTTAAGTTYEGSIERREDPEGNEEETVFHGFRRIAADGKVTGCDGRVHLAAMPGKPGRPGRYEVALTVHTSRAALTVSLAATCHGNSEERTACALEPGAWATLDGLGSFEIEGHHLLDLAAPAGTLVFHGAEIMHVTYQPDGCVQYTLEDRAPRTWCLLGGSGEHR